jgi:hypothetical protein
LILTEKDVDRQSLKLARRLAEQANQSSGGTNTEILDTLARAQFLGGDAPEAVATERRAAELAQGGDKAKLEEVLASYRAGKLPKD